MADSNWYTEHESSDKAKAIHSINIKPLRTFNAYSASDFTGYNTWDHWHLIPSSRPVVNPPKKKRTTIDVPGSNGIIEESDILRGFSTYSAREGSWEFYVDNDWGYWESRRSEIADAIHGLRCIVTLDDDPSYYYDGYIFVNEWKSEKDWSKIVLDYELSSYKMSYIDSVDEDWLWDPFNFETDWILPAEGMGLLRYSVNMAQGDNPDEWDNLYIYTGSLGRLPVSPIFIIEDEDPNHPIHVRLDNEELGISRDMFGENGIRAYNNQKVANFTLSTINPDNRPIIGYKGKGIVSLKFRIGRL